MPTYTAAWKVERRLHKVMDMRLPRPVGAREAVAFVATAMVLWPILLILGASPMSPSAAWIFVLGPAGIAHLSNQPVADGKEPGPWLRSQLLGLIQPRTFDGLAPRTSPDRLELHGSVWRPHDPNAGQTVVITSRIHLTGPTR